MNLSTYCETFVRRHLAPAGIAAAAIMAVVVGASPPPARAATMIDKSRYAEIGTGATRLVVHVNRGLNATTNRYSTYATTKAATINAIVQHVNALPKAPLSTRCARWTWARSSRWTSIDVRAVLRDRRRRPRRLWSGDDSCLQRERRAQGFRGGWRRPAFSMYVATQLHISSLQTF